MREYHDEVYFSYSHLREGETYSGEICPACKGGSTKEGSFSVSRSGAVLLYTCHRAACGFRGRSGYAPYQGTDAGVSPRKRTLPSVYTAPLNQEVANLLAEKYGISATASDLAGLSWSSEVSGLFRRRLCLPIWRPDLRKRGVNYRSLDGTRPKALTYLEEGEVGLSWYQRTRKKGVLVLVEDQLSAIRLSQYCDSVALLGTNFGSDKVTEVKEQGYRHLYLCLDNDATSTAIKLGIKLRDTLPSLKIIPLNKDIKDMTEEELASFLTLLER